MKEFENEQADTAVDLNQPRKLSGKEFFAASELSTGMLRDDFPLLLVFYCFLLIPEIVNSLLPELTRNYYFLFALSEPVIQLTGLYIICQRWSNRLRNQTAERIRINPVIFAFIGLLSWFFWKAPLLGMLWFPDNELRGLFPIAWTICLLLALRYYFYFIPLMFGQQSLREVLSFSERISAVDFFLPFKIMLAPFAINSLLIHAASAFSPDERLQLVQYFVVAVSGVFFVLTTYLSLAAGLTLLTSKQWREFQLDHYRRARLETLRIRGSSALASLLMPRNGMKIMLLAVLVAVGNFAQLSQLPPAAKITIEKVSVADNLIKVDILAQDPESHLRGFKPHFFIIAGEEFENTLSQLPYARDIKVDGRELGGTALSLTTERAEARFSLSFNADRSADDLKLLKDLHLWYRRVKIAPLDMSQAEKISAAPVAAASSDQASK